jgi:hypothetical protein
MKRLLLAAALLAPSACASKSPAEQTLERVFALERDDRAFQDLVQASPEVIDPLKAVMPSAPGRGAPVAAALYAHGEGDAVPLDLKARTWAAFRWPTAYAEENALIEPWTWDELERDLLLAGRHAVPLVARALAKESPDERCALRAARLLMRIGGRPAMEAFAGLLEADRDLGGARVMDVAAAALLVMGLQDLPLRQADPEAVVRAAREWWAAARGRGEDDWARESAAALAARRADRDPEAVEPVLELLEAGREGDAAAHLARLGEGRGAAFDANRRLERATGLSAWMPAWERTGDLRASLRLWRPPEDLALRWRRLLGGKLLRMSVSVAGYRPKEDAGALLWAHETVLHPTESDSVDLYIAAAGYSFHARARDLGTRVAIGEFSRAGLERFTRVYERAAVRPFVHFSPALKAAVLVAVEEVDARLPLRPPEIVKRDMRRMLRSMAETSDDAARALAYFQDKDDLPFFRERKAGAALLLLGDPAALELKPSLTRWEIEYARRAATDAGVRAYLDALQDADAGGR